MDSTVVKKAQRYATSRHHATGCVYGTMHPYEYHLGQVVAVFKQQADLLPDDKRECIECACWLHDVIEDCRVNYNDLVQEFGTEISDIVYNVTNELGKNRKERARKTYPKIAECPYSTFVKMCDRMANTQFSKSEKSSMFSKYVKEYAEFKLALQHGDQWASFWEELDRIHS